MLLLFFKFLFVSFRISIIFVFMFLGSMLAADIHNIFANTNIEDNKLLLSIVCALGSVIATSISQISIRIMAKY